MVSHPGVVSRPEREGWSVREMGQSPRVRGVISQREGDGSLVSGA